MRLGEDDAHAATHREVDHLGDHQKDPDVLAKVSEELGEAMPGIETSKLAPGELRQTRGW